MDASQLTAVIDRKIRKSQATLAQAAAFLAAYATHATLCTDLIATGDVNRTARAHQVTVLNATYTIVDDATRRIVSEVAGSTGTVYETRITILPSKGYHCNCPDKHGRGRVGPCKHVLALAQHWLGEEVLPGLQKLGASLP